MTGPVWSPDPGHAHQILFPWSLEVGQAPGRGIHPSELGYVNAEEENSGAITHSKNTEKQSHGYIPNRILFTINVSFGGKQRKRVNGSKFLTASRAPSPNS